MRDRLATLTPREFEVLKCVIAGMLKLWDDRKTSAEKWHCANFCRPRSVKLGAAQEKEYYVR